MRQHHSPNTNYPEVVKDAQRSTPQGYFEFEIERFGCETFQKFSDLLDWRLEDFFRKNVGQKVFPAVDLGAGAGAITFEHAKHFCHHHFSAALEWYPTEWINETGNLHPIVKMKESLQWRLDEAEGISPPLFADSSNTAVFLGDEVTLYGLSNDKFNGLKGIVSGRDPKVDNRFGVKLGNGKMISLKASNLTKEESSDDVNFDFAIARAQEYDILSGLLRRVSHVDILKRETWESLNPIKSRCALVTCTNLLTCAGYRDPLKWRDSLELASELLLPGGYFMQCDTDKYGRFGGAETMKRFVRANALDLELVSCDPVIFDGMEGMDTLCGGGKLVSILWRKRTPD